VTAGLSLKSTLRVCVMRSRLRLISKCAKSPEGRSVIEADIAPENELGRKASFFRHVGCYSGFSHSGPPRKRNMFGALVSSNHRSIVERTSAIHTSRVEVVKNGIRV
jgi:hypothetical protein